MPALTIRARTSCSSSPIAATPVSSTIMKDSRNDRLFFDCDFHTPFDSSLSNLVGVYANGDGDKGIAGKSTQ